MRCQEKTKHFQFNNNERAPIHTELHLHPCSQLPALLRFLAAHPYPSILPKGDVQLSGGNARRNTLLLHGERSLRAPVLGLPDGQVSAQAHIHTLLFHLRVNLPRIHGGWRAYMVHCTARPSWSSLQQRNRWRQHAVRRHYAEQQARRGAWLLRTDQQHRNGARPYDRPLHARPRDIQRNIPYRHGFQRSRPAVRSMC